MPEFSDVAAAWQDAKAIAQRPRENQTVILSAFIENATHHQTLYSSFPRHAPAAATAGHCAGIENKLQPKLRRAGRPGRRIFLCRNGNTLLFFFSKGGIHVKAYDAGHKSKGQTLLSGAGLPPGAVKQNQLCGLFSIGQNVVMFVQCTTGQNPGLYRLSISPDGKPAEAMKIADMENTSPGRPSPWLLAV